MTATYDLTTDIGKVRLNTFGDDTDNAIFTDEEISAFLTQETHVKLAAARLLLVVASREAFILKVQTNMGLTTDGAKLATEFRALAKTLKDEVAAEEAAAVQASSDDGFDVAEMAVDAANALEIYYNARLRIS